MGRIDRVRALINTLRRLETFLSKREPAGDVAKLLDIYLDKAESINLVSLDLYSTNARDLPFRLLYELARKLEIANYTRLSRKDLVEAVENKLHKVYKDGSFNGVLIYEKTLTISKFDTAPSNRE